jgi:hypothetical protein
MQIYALNNGGWFPTRHFVIDAVPGATIQPLDLPTEEQRIRLEAWGHSRVDSHMGKHYSVASCAVHRDSSLHKSTNMVSIHAAFAELSRHC